MAFETKYKIYNGVEWVELTFPPSSHTHNYLPLSGGELEKNATITLNSNGDRFLIIGGNSIIADMSNETSGWAGMFASVKDPAGDSTAMLGWYGGKSGLNYIYMGGTYSSPYLKMTKAGTFTFNTEVILNKVDTLKIPTSNGGTTYGAGTAGQVLKTNGTTIYWADEQTSQAQGTHSHDNKETLDEITEAQVVKWDTASTNATAATQGIAQLMSGVIVAGKAKADENGNVIANTYATKRDGVYFVDGGESTTEGTWIGTNENITEYYDGLVVNYKVGIAGDDTTTLNINGLGAKTCYLRGTTKLTTHYAVGTMVLLSYNATTDAFYSADYDANSYAYVRQYKTTTDASYPILFAYETSLPSSYDTKYTRKSAYLKFNPSTKVLTINGETVATQSWVNSNSSSSSGSSTYTHIANGEGTAGTSTNKTQVDISSIYDYNYAEIWFSVTEGPIFFYLDGSDTFSVLKAIAWAKFTITKVVNGSTTYYYWTSISDSDSNTQSVWWTTSTKSLYLEDLNGSVTFEYRIFGR